MKPTSNGATVSRQPEAGGAAITDEVPTRPASAPSGPAATPAARPRLLPLGALAAGFGLLGGNAFAQVAPPMPPASAPEVPRARDGATLSTISVKAKVETDQNSVRATTSTIGRANQDLRDIPQSVTVVTEKLLEDRRTDTVKEALHYTAGITFQAAEGGEEDIRLRGFSLTGSGDIYIDSIRDPAFYDRDVFNFDRIELLRGSASMLFGRGSTGGIVNQVSKQPLLTNVSEVQLTAGNGSYWRGSGDFNRKLTDTAAVRVNVVDNKADNYGNFIKKTGIAPTLRFGIGTADEVSLGYFYLNTRNGANYGIPWLRSNSPAAFSAANPAVLVPVNPRDYYAAASDYNASSASYGTADYTHRFDDGGKGHMVLRNGNYDRDQRASAMRFCTRAAATPDCPVDQPTLGTLSGNTILFRGGPQNKVQDLTSTYLQSDYSNTVTFFGRKNNLLGGIDMSRENFNNYAVPLPAGVVLDKNSPRVTLGNPDNGTSVDETLRGKTLQRNFVARALGVYAQDLIEVTDQWKVLAGLRYDRLLGRFSSPAAATPALMNLSRGDSLWSKRFGLLWQPTDNAAYYASYGTSFNASGELFLYDLPGSKAPPEKSRNIEIGSKYELFDGKLSSRVAVFQSTKYNERNRDSPTGQPLVDYLLSGRRHASGAELELAGRITPAWEAFLSYSWIPSAKIDEAAPNGTTSGEQVGQRPSLTPRHSGSLFTTYQLTKAFRFGGGATARSTQTPNRNPAGITAPGFVTYDAIAEYAFSDTLALKLNVLNLTNKLYADSLYTSFYVPGQARTAYLTLTARF